jgi:hypothetical protein
VRTCEEVAAIVDPVERAVIANDLMWDAPAGRRALRTLRAAAVTEALGSGTAADEIAARLSVRPTDLTWMTKTNIDTDWPAQR